MDIHDIEKVDYGQELVLIVDDEVAVRETVTEMLNHLGFNARSASTGKEAISLLETEPSYTFLITDMRMPEMDGMELIHEVHKRYPDICVIAMTGFSKGYRYIDVINAGATDFINKPFSIEELEAKVKRAIIERNIKRELNRLSITDGLTGLYNQRYFRSRLREEVKRARRQKHPLALILLDLDKFKWFNDTYGHLAGDELLQKVGTIIAKSIREDVDSGYRYGGDEFAIILIDADRDVAKEIAMRICNAIEKECSLGVSYGIANSSGDLEPEDLIHFADKELYKKKGIQLKKC